MDVRIYRHENGGFVAVNASDPQVPVLGDVTPYVQRIIDDATKELREENEHLKAELAQVRFERLFSPPNDDVRGGRY